MTAAANTVSLSTNFNRSPYYDDFAENKNFHRFIFRPGQAVQARELTQLQTVLQNQIDRFAEHVFKEGSAVRGCEIAPLDTSYDYVKLRDLTSTGASVNVYSFLDKLVKGSTSGIIGRVVNVNDGSQANTPNFKTLFVDYTAANTTTGFKTFANNEILTVVTNSALKANTITGALGGACGFGSSIRVNAGIIFAKDHFIRVDDQTIILDKYTNTPTYRVGFTITETIVSSADDTSLLDPASGSYNYAAPGADRLKLTATLAKTTTSALDANNFVEYVSIKNGILQSKSDATQYSQIRDEMAKRTREESGDYIVRGLSTRVREHFDSGTNQGVYTAGLGGNTSLLSIDVEPGKAYIQGYDNELLVTQHVAIDKGIDFVDVDAVSTYADYGNFVIVDNLVGNFDINGQDQVSLRGIVVGSAQANAVSGLKYSGTPAPGTEIGKARIRGLEYYSGTPGKASAQYKMYLTDIRITSAGKSFANTESITFTSAAGSGRADILGSNHLNANTTDPSYDRMVFPLPARAIRRLRDASNVVDTDYGFFKQFGAGGTTLSVDSSGVIALDTTSEGGSSAETLSGSGALSDTLARENYHVTVRTAGNTSVLTGTLSITGNTVTGSGTSFLTQVNPGDLLGVSSIATANALVSTIVSDTSLTLLNAPGNVAGKAFWKKFAVGQVLDLGGWGMAGTRQANVTSTTTASLKLRETVNTLFNVTVLAKLNYNSIEEADKAIVRNRLVRIKMGASGTTGYTANTSGPWNLGLSDAFRLVSVRQKGSAFASTSEGTDVTNHFYIDNGQRDGFYDHAKLVKKPTSNLTIAGTDYLLVTIDYFTHSNRQRGYFSIDSYPVDDTLAASDTNYIYTYEIPVFTSPVTGMALDLRDSVDFRPRLTDTANSVTSLTNISTNPLGIKTPVYSSATNDFAEPTGGLHTPYPSSLFTADLSYYLPRKDVIVMNKNGRAESIRGVSAIRPTTPKVDADKMSLAVIDISPYPSLPDEIARRADRGDLANSMRTLKNERFTMRDIGVIKDRVERLEYYTTLSLLEKDAKDLVIRDANGNDRFKNGFLVDNFTGHSVGNVYDRDYNISIDPSRKEARPTAKIDNLELFYAAANSSNIVRTNVTTGGVSRDQFITISNSQVAFVNGSIVTSGGTATVRFKFDNKLYIENATSNFAAAASITSGALSATISSASGQTPGKLMTLPYTHEQAIHQPFASTTRNIAGMYYNWIGVVSLDPNSDYWVDTTVLPDVQINIDNSVDNWETLPNAFGTQWGAWETVATGIPVLTSTETVTDIQSRGAPGGIRNNTSPLGSNFGGDGRTIGTTTNIETYTQDVVQQRVGTTMGVGLSTQTQTVGNIIRDVNIQPFMRSRVVRMTARAFKPSSRLYAFFDGIDVSSYLTPCNSSFVATGAEGSALTTNANGDVYALFRIPNEAALRFRTGEKIFRLSDSVTNESIAGLVTTSGQTVYASQGLTAQAVELTASTTVSDTAVNTVIETRTIQEVSQVTSQSRGLIEETSWIGISFVDPICQSFQVDTRSIGRLNSSGAFITKIDLYFAQKDDNLPVVIELRELDSISGYPTPKVLPYSRTIVESSAVNISTDGSKPTPVYFASPIHVQDGKQYAVAILPGGGSPNYRVWVSRLGDNDLVSGNRIAAQPAAGILFASSNDLTYTALQEEDLKFTLYFANFNVSTTGSIVLKNENKDYFCLANTSLAAGFPTVGEEIRGETYLKATFANTQQLFVSNGSTYVQGMVSGATGILTYYSTANGDARVKDVTSSFRGGEAVRIRLQSNTGTIAGNSTGGLKFAQYPKGRVSFFDATTSANTFLHVANVSFSNSGPATGTAANNRMFTSNRWIKGQIGGVKSKIVIMDKVKVDLINIKADYITPSNTSVTPSGKFATSLTARDTSYKPINLNGDTEFSARRYVLSESIEANTAASSAAMKDGSIEVKFDLTTNNRYGSPVFDTTRISATTIETLLNNDSTNEANTVSGGNARAKYITRKIILAEGQDAEDINVYLDAYNPPGTSVKLYYKVLHREDSDTFDQARWIQMDQTTSATAVSASEDRNDFRELQFGVPSYPVGAGQYHSGLFANSSPTNILRYRNSVGALYEGYKYLAIKIVLTGTNTTNPPRIRNLRVICMQK